MSNADSDDDFADASGAGVSSKKVQREIYRVGMKPPIFSKQLPDLYFCQLESQFRNAQITQDQTKFDYVVSYLEPQYLQFVSDIVRVPPAENKYDTLKNRLVAEFTDSEQRKLRRVIKEIELGDDKPSQLLKKMKDLAGNALTDDALKSLWLERLPENVRAVISIVEGDSTQWAKQADKIMEINNFSHIASVSNPLQVEVAALRKQIEEMKTQFRGRDKSRDNNKNNFRRSRSQSQNKQKFCFYHFHFGTRAKNCQFTTHGASEN